MSDTVALIEAVKGGRLDQVRELLDRGVSADAREEGREAETVLILAVRRGYIEIVRLLLAHGADVDGRSKDTKSSALISASAQPAIARLLIEAGATVGMANAYGQSALYSAARDDCAEVTAMLLEKGANPNATDIFRESPLHFAQVNSKHSVLPLLTAAAARAAKVTTQPSTKATRRTSMLRPVLQRLKDLFRARKPARSPSDYSTTELIRMLSVSTGRRESWQCEDGTAGPIPVPLDSRQVGVELNRRGGKTLMLAGHRESGGGRMLEIAWDGIGDWRG